MGERLREIYGGVNKYANLIIEAGGTDIADDFLGMDDVEVA